jgi:pimeloyl-ACP methyl ester carboxylesterase
MKTIAGLSRILAALALAVIIAGCASIPDPATEDVGTVNSADGSPIQYGVRGRGEITVVFIHCWTCNHRFWKSQIDHFSRSYRVAWLDLAGHGLSGSHRKDYTMQAFGADVAAVVKHIGGERVVLVGHSMGGPVAIEAAKLLGDRVIGIVGVDTFYTPFEWPKSEAEFKQFVKPFEDDFKGTSGQMVRSMFPPDVDPAVSGWILDQMATGNREMGISAMYSMFHWNAGEGPASLKRYAGILRNINAAPAGEAAAPHAGVTLVANAGHFVAQVKPKEFNRILEKIIAEYQAR